jgi:hypothetical protein
MVEAAVDRSKRVLKNSRAGCGSSNALGAIVRFDQLALALKPSRRLTLVQAVDAHRQLGSYIHEQVFPADEGDRVEAKTLMQDHRAWCTKKGLTPIALAEFLDEIEKLLSSSANSGLRSKSETTGACIASG